MPWAQDALERPTYSGAKNFRGGSSVSECHAHRADRAALRSSSSASCMAAPSASSRTSATPWCSSATKSRCSPQRMRTPTPSWSPVRDRSIRLDPAPLKSDVAAHLSMLHEVRRRALAVRRPAFPHRPAALSRSSSTRPHRDRDDAAWPAGPEGPEPRVSALAAVRPRLDLRSPAHAAAVRQLARDGSARHADAAISRSARGRSRATSPSSGGSRRRSGRTWPSRSRAARACR